MTKNETESYKRKIDKAADALLMDAYKIALDEVDRIHRDILWSLSLKIDEWFDKHPEE